MYVSFCIQSPCDGRVGSRKGQPSLYARKKRGQGKRLAGSRGDTGTYIKLQQQIREHETSTYLPTYPTEKKRKETRIDH